MNHEILISSSASLFHGLWDNPLHNWVLFHPRPYNQQTFPEVLINTQQFVLVPAKRLIKNSHRFGYLPANFEESHLSKGGPGSRHGNEFTTKMVGKKCPFGWWFLPLRWILVKLRNQPIENWWPVGLPGLCKPKNHNFCSVPGSLLAQVVLQSKWILKNLKKLHGVSILVDYMHPFITSSRQKLRKSTKH